MISENPSWVPLNATEIEDLVEKFTKEGVSPAMIGMILRDQYAVPNVKLATGKTVTEIQAEKGVKGDLPADLAQLMVRAINLNNHLKVNHKDISNKRSCDDRGQDQASRALLQGKRSSSRHLEVLSR